MSEAPLPPPPPLGPDQYPALFAALDELRREGQAFGWQRARTFLETATAPDRRDAVESGLKTVDVLIATLYSKMTWKD